MAELAGLVARALSHDYAGAASGRVTDVPSVRVIRWYQTIGLVGRPAETRGRTALYGPRHLRQIVAVKRLQAEGHSLADIQARLLGAGDDVLAEVARVPEELLSARSSAPATRPPSVDVLGAPSVAVEAASEHRRFWAQRPATADDGAFDDRSPNDRGTRRGGADGVVGERVAGGDGVPGNESAPGYDDVPESDSVSVPEAPGAPPAAPFGGSLSAELSYGVPLGAGVTLLYTAARPPSPEETAALRATAGPLLAAVGALREGRAPITDHPIPDDRNAEDDTTEDPTAAANGSIEGATS